ILICPSLQEPCWHAEFRSLIRPSNWLAIDFAQNRIHEASSRALLRALDQLDAFRDGGVSGDAFQVPELVYPHPQGDADFLVQLELRPAGVMRDQVIELRLETQTPKYDGFGQGGVASGDFQRLAPEEVGGISATRHALENAERDFARR